MNEKWWGKTEARRVPNQMFPDQSIERALIRYIFVCVLQSLWHFEIFISNFLDEMNEISG